jgi:DNA polymerase theta
MLEAVWEEFKVQGLFDWQIECLTLEPVLKQNKNLIFSAPTSAGKSIVADLLYLRNLMLQPDKCVIYVMPFVSLIAEKEKKLTKLCEILKLKF